MAEQIVALVDPLVDSLVALILAGVNRELTQIHESCEKIAQQTTRLVEATSQHALNVDDPDLIDDLTSAINQTATTVGALVQSFKAMMDDYVATKKKAFAVATKEFGDALNRLILTLDTSFVRKIEKAVREARASVGDFGVAARTSKEELLRTAQLVAGGNIQVVKAAESAGRATLDPKKAKIFNQGSSDVKQYSTAVIRAGQGMANNPNDGRYGDDFFDAERQLYDVFDLLLETARKTSLLGFGRLGDLLSTIDDLLARLEELRGGLAAMVQAIGTDDFIGRAKDTLRQVMELMAQGQKVIDATDDPIVKYKLEQLLEQLRDGTKRLVKAAQEAHKDPNNKAKREEVLRIQKELDAIIEEVMKLLNPDSPLSAKQRVVYGTQICDALSNKASLVAGRDSEELRKATRGLLLTSDQIHRDARKLGTQMANEDLEKELLEQTRTLRNQVHALTNAAPRGNVDKQRNDIFATDKAIRDVVLGDWSVKKKRVPDKKLEGLVAAAREQREQALRVAEQAEKFAQSVNDASRKNKILELAKTVRGDADDLVRDAEAYNENPQDQKLEQRYAATQKRLASNIGEIVNLCGDQAAKDALSGLFGLQQGSGDGDIFQQIDGVISAIDEVYGSLAGNPQAGVVAAKDIGDRCKSLSSSLRKMANNPEADGGFREQLTSYSNGVRDQALQIKILSAVKLADLGTQDDGNSKTSSGNEVKKQVKGLRTNLVDLKKQLFAESLRRRTSNTKKQADAIKRIAQAFINRSK